MSNKPDKPTMINLQEFITEALVQIIEGVKEAQLRVSESGAKINPTNTGIQDGIRRHSKTGGYSTDQYGQDVEFDVAVTAVDKGEIKGGIGVVSSLVNLGYQAEKGLETSSISRIRFSVPVFLPEQAVEVMPRKDKSDDLKQASRYLREDL